MRKLFGTLFAVAIAIVFGFSTYVMADPPPTLEKDKAKAEEKMEKADAKADKKKADAEAKAAKKKAEAEEKAKH